jgi:heptaprenyl diphosphate synthase
MTPLAIELAPSADDHRIARLAALAIGLAVLEAGVPLPLPGVKPGLANVVTLLVLARYGLRDAAWVSLLRVTGAGLILGTFLSPGFVLSLAGALASLAVLALAIRLPGVGPVGQSILASFAHVGGQLAVVYGWLIPSPGVLYLAPVFAGAALLFGTVNGLVAARLLRDPEPS